MLCITNIVITRYTIQLIVKQHDPNTLLIYLVNITTNYMFNIAKSYYLYIIIKCYMIFIYYYKYSDHAVYY